MKITIERSEDNKENSKLIKRLGKLGYRWKSGETCSTVKRWGEKKYLVVYVPAKTVGYRNTPSREASHELSVDTLMKGDNDVLWKYEWVKNNKNAIKIFLEMLSAEELLIFELIRIWKNF